MTVDVPAGCELMTTEQARRLRGCAAVLSDLDRSAVGRHRGDSESQDETGRSQGNQFLTPGQRIGTSLSGKPIIFPNPESPFTNLAQPELWYET